MNKKKLLIGIVILLLIIAAFFFFRGRSSARGLRLEVAPATLSTITNVVTATGTVEPVTLVEVGTQVSGIIDKIYVDYNSEVKKGQVIAEMDRITLQADLASQEADLASSKAQFEYEQSNYNRSKLLHDKQLISDTDFELANYSYQTAKSTYERNNANIIKVRQNLGYATITSPIDGVVINRAVEEGQTVAAGFSTPTLFTIANDLTQMQVIANVDEADIGQVEEGQNVSFMVDAYPDDIFEGKVMQLRLEATIESNVVTYEVVISAYNPDLKLKPGLTANVTIYTLERPDVLVVPSKALRFLPDEDLLKAMKISIEDPTVEAPAGQKVVWQYKGERLQPKFITIGSTSGNQVEVIQGLTEGEEVVVDLTSEAPPANGPENGNAERSPFMPGRPGGGRR